jgi:hypothetical protein
MVVHGCVPWHDHHDRRAGLHFYRSTKLQTPDEFVSALKGWIGGHSRAKNAAAAYSTLEFGFGRKRIPAVSRSCF